MNKIVLFVVILHLSVSECGNHKTLLISCDAFRWNYLQIIDKPANNLQYLISNGAFANYGIRNQFTTITLPNHVSLATGLNVDDHGIVGNDMFDPLFNESFAAWKNVNGSTVNWDDGNFKKDTKWMNNVAEPIWVTLGRQGVGKSAIVMWPFSSYTFNGAAADFWIGWNGSVAYEDRVDQLVSKLEKDDYQFGILYIEELDEVGHKYGPFSKEMVDAVLRVDDVIGYLLARLGSSELWPCCVDIILTADHGMTQINSENAVHLPKYVDVSKFWIYDQTILPVPGFEREVFLNLSRAPNMRIYYKNESTPASEHYSHHRRIHDIVYFLDDGFYLSGNDLSGNLLQNDRRSEEMKRIPVGASTWGSHGYDNRFSSMWPVFIASGPSFKRNITVEPFSNTQVYCVICWINRVKPHPNADCNSDHTLRVMEQLLLEPTMHNIHSSRNLPLLTCSLLFLGGILLFIFIVAFGVKTSSELKIEDRKVQSVVSTKFFITNLKSEYLVASNGDDDHLID